MVSGVYVDVGRLEGRKADEHGEDIWPASDVTIEAVVRAQQ
jgi:hypothetical protein